jgi:hypothetical protein
VCEKVAALAAAACEHLTALLFVGNTVEEMREQIRMFARHVVPAFPEPATVARPAQPGSCSQQAGNG